MLALRREHPSLLVHKHSVHEEVRTGADWEWWLGTRRMDMPRLPGKGAGRPWQVRRHNERAAEGSRKLTSCCGVACRDQSGSTVPFGPCTASTTAGRARGPKACRGSMGPIRAPCPHGTSTLWVRRRRCLECSAGVGRPQLLTRRTLRDSYLPVSRPWSMIFSDPAESTVKGPETTMKTTLAASMSGRPQPTSGPQLV